MKDYINTRAMGERLPLSIPTAMAIETTLENEGKSNPTFSAVWINVRTLLRNLVNSVDKEGLLYLNEDLLIDAIISEMEVINTCFSQIKNRKQVFYYINHYDKVKRLFPEAFFREAKTERQFLYKNITDSAMKILTQLDYVKQYDLDIIPVLAVDSIMLSHIALDLTSQKHFKNLYLLESHTGKIKDKSQWHSKFSTENKNPSITFSRSTLAILGDSDIFAPQLTRYRVALSEIASKYNWSNVTTLDRMKFSIGMIKDKEIKDHLLKFIR